jgi:acetyl/propionyl-CoA carboxylase alpha subunit/acetyl-CoA carboxylase carboxyltransferase component
MTEPQPPTVLIANRGEVAVRIAATLADLGLRAVMVHSADDAGARHTRAGDTAVALAGTGPAAYLDGAAIIAAARAQGAVAIHPGYGFLSENAGFARACADAGLVFIGADPATLDRFGDKAAARAHAARCGVAIPAGVPAGASAAEIAALFTAAGQVAIKAVAGGGGRGIRIIGPDDDVAAALALCSAEAEAAFSNGAVYAEAFLPVARHIEIQAIGDGTAVCIVSDRDCSLQRRRQKLVEFAPAPGLAAATRVALFDAARALATDLNGLATFEVLVTPDGFAFIEANPRLQVEHTVTEEIHGLDLVAIQVRIALGATLADLGLGAGPLPAQGAAVQIRINLESIAPDGSARPAAGTITCFDPPAGPGIRIDSGVGVGSTANPRFDTLAAKLIVRAVDPAHLLAKARRALANFHIEGAATNIAAMAALLDRAEVAAGDFDTGLVDRIMPEIAAGLAPAPTAAESGDVIRAPITGIVAEITVADGDAVAPGTMLMVIEAMKMLNPVEAPGGGTLGRLLVANGAMVSEGQPLVEFTPGTGSAAAAVAALDLDLIPPLLAALHDRKALLLDAARPAAVARRRARGQRTARENVDGVLDPGSFVESGGLAIAAQRRRRSVADLERETPADGLITGFGSINGDRFAPAAAAAAILVYDFTVLAGTQGYYNHKKTDRLLGEAARLACPVVLFAEGGGGRPGDVDSPGVAGLDVTTFGAFAALSGRVPLVGVVTGKCFAGNAVLLGCCDVIIATPDSYIGMSGPAMIEGAGLGSVRAEDIGPFDTQWRNGVIDIAVADEVEGAAVARQYLSYFQGPLPDWQAADQRALRFAIPDDPRRGYRMRDILGVLADAGSVLELRGGFGGAVITALARIEGVAVGILASDPGRLAGAIDADAGDKAARFMRLCDAFGLPLISLVDTPGFMVGPEEEARAQVRRACRMVIAGARLRVPNIAVFVRRGFGLGSQAMVGGSFHAPLLTLAWPTGLFGAMGLEGSVRLGFRKELEAVAEGPDRDALFAQLLARVQAAGAATNMAAMLEIDDVIDPAETRAILARTLHRLPPFDRTTPAAPFIDSW